MQSIAPQNAELMREDIRLEVASDPQLLESIRAVVRTYAARHGLSAERVCEVVLALDEACSNSIRHAYQGRKTGRLYLSLRSGNGVLEFELRDDGIPASEERTQRKALETPSLDMLQPGGLGVQLIYGVFDEVQFERGEDKGNCVTMRLKGVAEVEASRDSAGRQTHGS
jgi:anti-sigma regulatory factor (Ser/Thr protein kinase)